MKFWVQIWLPMIILALAVTVGIHSIFHLSGWRDFMIGVINGLFAGLISFKIRDRKGSIR